MLLLQAMQNIPYTTDHSVSAETNEEGEGSMNMSGIPFGYPPSYEDSPVEAPQKKNWARIFGGYQNVQPKTVSARSSKWSSLRGKGYKFIV